MTRHDTHTTTKWYIGQNNKAMDQQTIKPENIIEWAKTHLKGATIYETKGIWMNEAENSLVIETVNIQDPENIINDSLKHAVKESEDPAHIYIKETLEHLFNQDSVMTMQTDSEVTF